MDRIEENSLDVDVPEEYRTVLELYREIESVLRDRRQDLQKIVPEVSMWSIGMQIEHVLIANRRVLLGLTGIARGRRGDGAESMNRLGRILLGRGTIPRGKAEAPDKSVPSDSTSVESLVKQFEQSREGLLHLEPHLDVIAASDDAFEHPYFGNLSAPVWVRFLHVHTLHHLKIVRDIASKLDLNIDESS